jgi:hypothetical protein
MPPDHLNDIGVLTRREIEARILAPFIEALSREFDRGRVLAILRETIAGIARAQGAQRARDLGGNSLALFAQSSEAWKRGAALECEVLALDETRYDYDVTRCRYAEMYQALGIPELGALLSCNRDAALIEGFNPDVVLTRAGTLMEGAPRCDFRYAVNAAATGPADAAMDPAQEP